MILGSYLKIFEGTFCSQLIFNVSIIGFISFRVKIFRSGSVLQIRYNPFGNGFSIFMCNLFYFNSQLKLKCNQSDFVYLETFHRI